MESQAEKQKEKNSGYRKAPRYAVPWRIVVVYKKKGAQETHHGAIADLSIGGASFFSEVNIHSFEPVVVTIEIPAYMGRRKVIVGVKCQILYSVLSSNYGMFRVVLKFLHFNKNGKRDMTEALSTRTALGEYESPFF